MTEQIPPTQSEELPFSRSIFGYDSMEVRAFIDELNTRLDQLEDQQGSLMLRSGSASHEELALVIDSAVGDISEVLEAARIAAKKIRDRAEYEASDSRVTGAEQVRKIVVAAEADAFVLRKSAWDTSTELLESVKAEAARLLLAAKRDSLGVISDAERKAHRRLAAARRDSENAMRAASAECDRLLGLARSNGQEIVRAARDRAQTAHDRAASLESRHQVLMQEVEAFQAKLEGPSGSSAASETSTVRIVHRGDSDTGQTEGIEDPEASAAVRAFPENGSTVATAQTVGWADGTESVRLVETPTAVARVEVDALDLTDEAAGIGPGDDGMGTEPVTDPYDGGENGGAEPIRLDRVPSGQPRRTGADRELTKTRMWATPADSGATDELAALFLELRMKEATTAGATAEGSGSKRDFSPLEVYDRNLLPVTNRALRAVKRQLIDIESEQLKSLEADPDAWQPARSSLAPYLVHALSVMEREAIERGYTVAGELSDTRLAAPRREAPSPECQQFISDLLDEVVTTVGEGRGAGRTSREISRAVSRVYRSWRTDQAERRLRFLAGRAYHHGITKGLRMAGVNEFRIDVNEGCDECAMLDGQVMTEDNVPMIPVHSECRCMVLPA